MHRLVAVVPFVCLACHSSADSSPAPLPAPLVTNLGLAGERLFGSGALRFVTASEEGQARDLDGDGDTSDRVLQLLDLQFDALVNTGLAVPALLRRDEVPPPMIGCSAALGVFVVDEAATGFDADHDGNAQELSTWTFERATGRIASLPVGYDALTFDGAQALLEGHDDVGGVLNVFAAETSGLTRLPGVSSGVLFFQDGVLGFLQNESLVFDLNLDGDLGDSGVLQLYDVRTHELTNTHWALGGTARRLGDFVSFFVSESQQGGTDINTDGDALDNVLVTRGLATGITRFPRLAQAVFAEDPRGAAEVLLLLAAEGERDRNGDGDTLDQEVLLYDPSLDLMQHTGLASHTSPLGAGRWIGVSVSEAEQGFTDLDDDGRTDGQVLHVVDAQSGAIQNLGLQGVWVGTLAGHLLIARDEQAGDWNGDGDQDDLVFFDWSARTHSVRNTGRVVGALFGSAGERALVTQLEFYQRVDLNGDGDQQDFVLALYDGRTGEFLNLGLATLGQAWLGADGRAAALVSEALQGADLNGDGDLLDQVLHTLELGG
ncbi:MAG: hypothetical protein EXS08_01730 [Planctomycetes bacterium]|nr:hypothetical protein [Planctomycetota bacterium]